MNENLNLIFNKLKYLLQMRIDVEHSISKLSGPMLKIEADEVELLTLDERETLSAFMTRFAAYQEHIANTLKSIAIEEEIDTSPFGTVLAAMEKLGILDDIEKWKLIRNLRNAITHDYEENADDLFQIINEMIRNVPFLINTHTKMAAFVQSAYPAPVTTNPQPKKPKDPSGCSM